MKQTAVEWLIEEIECRGIVTKELRLACEQAKEMEKAERMYSEEDMRLAIKKARDISDEKDCFDAEDISGCTEVCTYGWKFNMSEDLIIESI